MIKRCSDFNRRTLKTEGKSVLAEDKEEKREKNPTTGPCEGPVTEENLGRENMTPSRGAESIFVLLKQ